MSKTDKPLFGFNVRGTLGKALTFRKSGPTTIAEKKPIPTDAKSLAQLSWRTMYQKATALWHALSPAEQQDWESQATRKHMTGYAWFMSQCLKPNPGLYLPLQGGTMKGDIDMSSSKILNLPVPTADEEPTRKQELSNHAALTTGVHGLAALHAAGFHSAGQAVSRVIWKDLSQAALEDLNRTETLDWTTLDLTAYTSADAKIAFVRLQIHVDTVGTGARCLLRARQNGTTSVAFPEIRVNKEAVTAGNYFSFTSLVGMDSGQVIEYNIIIDTGWQIDSYIDVLGYIE